MKTKLLGVTLASALALSSVGAAPARADQNFNNFVAAAAAIVIIGTALSASNQRSNTRTVYVERRTRRAPPPVVVYRTYPHPCPFVPHLAPVPGPCWR